MEDERYKEKVVSPVPSNKETDASGSQAGLDGAEVRTTQAPPARYDPMQESVWTRLGLSFESYKRAPGSTG